MPELNINIPHLEVFVRNTFLHNLDPAERGLTRGIAHAVSCIKGRALGFHVLLENGAHIGRLPIHAIQHTDQAEEIPGLAPWRLQLWDCFSSTATCTIYDWLDELRMRVYLPDKSIVGGAYQFTIDYHNDPLADAAGDTGWKCHHIIELDNGLYAAQPNNRVAFFEPSMVVPFQEPPTYKTMTHTWKVEDGAKWRSSDDNLMFYGVDTPES